MSLWDHLPVEHLGPDDESRRLIEEREAGNVGLGPARWVRTLESIRALPEVADA